LLFTVSANYYLPGYINMSVVPLLPVYFENGAGRILENATGRYLYLRWSANERDTENFRALLNHLARALVRHKWSKVLAIQQTMQPLNEEELRWMLQEWLPQAMHQAGYRHGAIVLPQQPDARLTTAQLTNRAQQQAMNYQTFEEEAEAVAWLMHQPD